MAYLGPPPSQKLATPTSQYFSGNGSATAFTLNRPVNVAEDLNVYVNNVAQQPGSGKSYTATGTTLTFDAAPDAGTNNVYVVYRGLAEPTTRLEHPSGQPLAATTGTFSGALTATAGASSNAISLQSANFKMTDLTTNAFYRTGTFTPTFTPFTVGNGSVFGNYIRIGDLVHVNFGFAFGSTSSIGGDIYSITGLPFAAAENISGGTVSYVPIPFICWDNGAQWRQGIGQLAEGGTGISYPSITAVANSYPNATNPFTWATGDSMTFTGTYTTDAA